MDPGTIAYYGACYVVAATAGIARLLYDRGADALGYGCGVMFLSGFIGFGGAAFCGGDDVLGSGRLWIGIAIAAFLGLGGPESIHYVSLINGKILKTLGFDTEEE